MATKPFPGRQQIRQRETRAALDRAVNHLASHRKMCGTCHKYGVDQDRYCDTGWELVKAEWKARGEWRRARQEAVPGEQTLF